PITANEAKLPTLSQQYSDFNGDYFLIDFNNAFICEFDSGCVPL
ncbi:4852_t:CDS:2, partial [Gigaspora margarita]